MLNTTDNVVAGALAKTYRELAAKGNAVNKARATLERAGVKVSWDEADEAARVYYNAAQQIQEMLGTMGWEETRFGQFTRKGTVVS